MYAIVDIETTGNHSINSGITEVAVVISNGKEILDKYVALIDPEARVPRYIEALTGINNKMLEGAPKFSEIAHELHQWLTGRIFVAHNVNFDYSFLKNKFEENGLEFNEKKLCTVRLSRQIIPGLSSYSLGRLIRELGIQVVRRHRAEDDAVAAAEIFHYLVANDREGCIAKSLKRGSKEAVFPPNFCREDFEKLPQKPGVYYFMDHKGRVIYVGKANNLKQRVLSHFTGKSDLKNKQRFYNSVQHVDYELCGNELIALLFESLEIKRLWPEYNQSQKTINKSYGIYLYEDQRGYLRMNVGKLSALQKPIAIFRSQAEARSFLHKMVADHHLCARLCGLQKTGGACFGYSLGQCHGACQHLESPSEYNLRMHEALSGIGSTNQSFLILGNGRFEDEKSIIMIENGNYVGFGYVEKDVAIMDKDQARQYIRPTRINPDIQTILEMHLRQYSDAHILRF